MEPSWCNIMPTIGRRGRFVTPRRGLHYDFLFIRIVDPGAARGNPTQAAVVKTLRALGLKAI